MACVRTRYFSLLLVSFNGVDVSQIVLLPPFERSLEQQGNFTQPTARGKKDDLTYLNAGYRVFQTLM